MAIYSFSPFGYEGALVTVEVDLRRGIPMVDIVGLADGAVKESRERMISAIKNQGFEFPSERVLISLSPADLKKEGAGFDLPLALAVLSEKDDYPRSQDAKVMVMGELELSGTIRPVRAVYSALSSAVSAGIKYAIIPKGYETAIPKGINVEYVENLREAYDALVRFDEAEALGTDFEEDEPMTIEDVTTILSNGGKVRAVVDDYVLECGTDEDGTYYVRGENSDGNDWISNYESEERLFMDLNDRGATFSEIEETKIEFNDIPENNLDSVEGHNGLKYAMAVAVAGRHHLLAYGAPGCGKTMVLQHMPELMPKLLPEESQSTTRIYSIAGLLRPNEGFKTDRPFRMPHQTTSIEGICGGGVNCRPGEISLAHNGVLFLDEATEFRSSVLQMLRVPLETQQITLARAGRSTIYPARFQLVMATNPCPCGNYGSKDKICLCSAKSVEMYWLKFSGPLLDRIAIRFNVEDDEFSGDDYSLENLRRRIKSAWERQYKRQRKLNQDLTPQEVADYIKTTDGVKSELERLNLNMRTVSNILKLARTIADMNDLEETDVITERHLDLALQIHGYLPGIVEGMKF
jgi:magnesium chelatase family protein